MAKLPVRRGGQPGWLNEAYKLPLGQDVDVLTPCQVQFVLEVKGHHWLTGGRLTRLSGLPKRHPQHYLKGEPNPEPRNSASSGREWRFVASVYREILGTYSSRSDLDELPESPEVAWFTDGNSSVEGGTQKAGYTTVSLDEVTEVKAQQPQT